MFGKLFVKESKKKNTGMVQVHLRLEPEIAYTLDKICDKTKRSRNNLCNFALSRFCREFEKEYGS